MKKDNSTVVAVIFLIFLILLAVFITLVVKVFPKQVKEEPEIVKESTSYDIEDYIELEKLTYNDYSLYDEINISKINVKNLNNNLTKKFLSEQDNLLKKVDNDYSLLTDETFNNSIKTDITYEINKNILSVKFELIENIEELKYNNNYIIVLNIDLDNKKILSTSEMIDKYSEDISLISLNIFNQSVYMENSTDIFEDADTKEQTNMTNIENNQEMYLERIQNKIDEIAVSYVKDKKLYISYSDNKAKSVCYTIPQSEETKYITLE